MKKLTLLFAIIGLGLVGTLNAQSIKGNTQATELKTKVIKVKPFAPLLNNIAFGYEQQIQDNITGEVSFGLIGTGFAEFDEEKSGFYLTAGPKLYFGQDWTMEGMKNIPMRGAYFKPELIFSTFKSTRSEEIGTQIGIEAGDYRATSGALLFNLGRQYIAADVITFEISAGLGYGFSRHKGTDDNENWEEGNLNSPFFNSHIQGGKNFPLASKADITIGFLLK